jgi:serine/threonine protein kinase
MISQTLGYYHIIEKIGVGGMGEVYCSHDHQLDCDVALKVLLRGTPVDETARELFRKKALALAKLNHPNIETVFEFSTQYGKDFLPMELVPGSSLRERLKQGPRAGAVFRMGNTIRRRTGCGSRTRHSASGSQIMRTRGVSIHVHQTSVTRWFLGMFR